MFRHVVSSLITPTTCRAFTDDQLQRNNGFQTQISSIYDTYIDYNETVGKTKVNTQYDYRTVDVSTSYISLCDYNPDTIK